MNVLMISTDKKIFENNSDVRKRIIKYSSLFDELNVVVLTSAENGYFSSFKYKNLTVIPTNSKNKIYTLFNAFKIAKDFSNIDYISSQDPFENGLLAFFVSRHFNAKLQLQVHTDFLNPYFKKESIKNKIRIFLADFLLPKANSVRVVSKRIEKSIKNRYKLKIKPVVLPIFIDKNLFKNNKSKEKYIKDKYKKFDFLILMASRLTKEKNIALAIESLNELIKKNKDINVGLIILGDGPEKDKLKKKVSDYNLNRNVVFEGWKSNLAPYYFVADLFLLTSNYEGYARTIIEALMCNLPVVSCDVGCAKEVGCIITSHFKNDICKKIEEVIKNKPKINFKYEYKNEKDFLNKYKKSFI